MTDINNIQWFPGHMAKTRRKISEDLKKVDVVVEVLDARAPLSSGNPEVESIIASKPRMIVLGKTDLADTTQTKNWIKFYRARNIACVPFSVKNKSDITTFKNEIEKLMSEKLARWKLRGMIGRSLKLMVVGIPNVGKSAIINCLIGGTKAKVENRPGVTRNNQWFSSKAGFQILDTPGVLWPKFDDQDAALNLAFMGSIKDDILDIENLAVQLIERIKDDYISNICERFKINESDFQNLEQKNLLNTIAKKRGMISSGGNADTLRAANMILDEFRFGRLGKITLEKAFFKNLKIE